MALGLATGHADRVLTRFFNPIGSRVGLVDIELGNPQRSSRAGSRNRARIAAVLDCGHRYDEVYRCCRRLQRTLQAIVGTPPWPCASEKAGA